MNNETTLSVDGMLQMFYDSRKRARQRSPLQQAIEDGCLGTTTGVVEKRMMRNALSTTKVQMYVLGQSAVRQNLPSITDRVRNRKKYVCEIQRQGNAGSVFMMSPDLLTETMERIFELGIATAEQSARQKRRLTAGEHIRMLDEESDSPVPGVPTMMELMAMRPKQASRIRPNLIYSEAAVEPAG